MQTRLEFNLEFLNDIWIPVAVFRGSTTVIQLERTKLRLGYSYTKIQLGHTIKYGWNTLVYKWDTLRFDIRLRYTKIKLGHAKI